MSFLTAVEHDLVELPMPTWAYGVLALVVFFSLAVVIWSFRDVSNRHAVKADAYAAAHGGATSHSGH
jgi:protein-S-isoprenylcysteine O-methyltransferase Ste14